MYRIGICDDGINICADIENMVLLYAKKGNIKIETEIWYTGEGLCEYLQRGESLDVLFLDIELYELSGLEVAAYIRNKLEDRGMQIVYISAKSSYAQRLFKTQPLDFLVKPIMQAQIDEVLDMAIKIIYRSNKKFEFQCGKDYYYVPFGEILYFVSEGRKIKIITPCGEREFYGKLKDICRNLPDDFIVIHQSYIVNKQYIYRYTYEVIELVNGTILTISKVNRKRVRDKILREGQ